MAVTPDTKLRWFDRGAEAFERTFPGHLSQQFGADVGPLYVCPICDRVFSREAVLTGELTAEHVPPKSFQGRELVLTCAGCNNGAGTRLEAHARRKEDVLDALAGSSRRAMKIEISYDDLQVRARLNASVSGWKMDIVKKANHEAVVKSFMAKGPPRESDRLRVSFSGDRFKALGADLTWLRAGFLALFACCGYRFTFDPAIAIVKRQLNSTDSKLIEHFSITTHKQQAWRQWVLLEIPDPRCTGVLFGRYVPLFPLPGELTFYERLAEDIRTGRRQDGVNVTAHSYELAIEPPLGFEWPNPRE